MTILLSTSFHNMADGKYIYTVGRRKRTTAVLKLYPSGDGSMTVTSEHTQKPLLDFFGGHHYLYEDALYPFHVIDPALLKKVTAEIKISGGGIR